MGDTALASATTLQQALLIAALADGQSRFMQAEVDEETQLLINGLLALGVVVLADPLSRRIDVVGAGGYWPNSDAEIDCEASFPVACLMTAACALGRGRYTVVGRSGAGNVAPFIPLLSSLVDLHAAVDHSTAEGRVQINVGAPVLLGGTTSLPPDCPTSVFESLMMVAPYAASDVFVEARLGTFKPHPQVFSLMEHFGVSPIEDRNRYIVAAPQRYQARELML